MDLKDSTERGGGGQLGGLDWGELGSTKMFLTTNPGLESVVEKEWAGLLGREGIEIARSIKKPFAYGGQVLVESEGECALLERIALRMRSVHYVQVLLYGFELPLDNELESIERELESLVVEPLREAQCFRVTTKRSGRHAFSSMDVQRVAGAVLGRNYGCAVDLKDYDVNVRVDVYDRFCLVGLQLNDRALSNRHRRKYSPRAALKAPVAYALLQWARLEADASSALLDPFCGSGTILIEAGQLWPQLELCGCDIDERAVNGARVNAAAAGLGDRLQLLRADARRLDEVYAAGSFRTIVTNPPYGVRFGKHLNFSRFYQRLLHQCWTVLAAGGIMVVVVWKRGLFSRALSQSGCFKMLEKRVVETGDLYPAIYVLEKIEIGDQSTIE